MYDGKPLRAERIFVRFVPSGLRLRGSVPARRAGADDGSMGEVAIRPGQSL
jgi:hypothetical protein